MIELREIMRTRQWLDLLCWDTMRPKDTILYGSL